MRAAAIGPLLLLGSLGAGRESVDDDGALRIALATFGCRHAGRTRRSGLGGRTTASASGGARWMAAAWRPPAARSSVAWLGAPARGGRSRRRSAAIGQAEADRPDRDRVAAALISGHRRRRERFRIGALREAGRQPSAARERGDGRPARRDRTAIEAAAALTLKKRRP
jgi:hypothetical protein